MGLFDYLDGLFGSAGESAGGRWNRGESSADDSPERTVDFGQVAEAFATDHAEREFDFTVESLDRLDAFVATELDAEGVSEAGDTTAEGDLPTEPTLSLGSYFGEVLVRAFDGEWAHRDSIRVVVPAGATNVAVQPFDAGRVALRDEPKFARTAEQLRDRVGGTADEAPGLKLDLGADDAGDTPPETADSPDDVGDTRTETTDPADDTVTTGDESATEGAATDSDSTFPVVDLDAGMDLDRAHERTLETFEDAGYRVTAGDLLNSMPENPVEDVGKLFLFYSATEMYTGVVYVGEWDESDTQAVLSLAQYLRADDELDGLHVVSAEEPPDAVTYLTTSHTRAVVALDALSELADGPAFSAESAPEFADLGAELLARHADVRVDRTDTETLARLDEFVLDVLRVADHDAAHEGYVPRETLLALGALAGEVVRHGLERELPVTVEWGTDDEISSTGVVLQITTADADGTLTVNPVGKVFKLFASGESERVADLYETVLQVVRDQV